ncbi:hypothetical protein T01_3284 [Trichinella spiralis]|uniref:Uncharacterized protein n=1 Tax=Trichinella spiralis TaxID=6334 RepID=A0A0V1AJT8_TRISP|nr:hypothetical protein T01_3284 [Trichinella spiralis]
MTRLIRPACLSDSYINRTFTVQFYWSLNSLFYWTFVSLSYWIT